MQDKYATIFASGSSTEVSYIPYIKTGPFSLAP